MDTSPPTPEAASGPKPKESRAMLIVIILISVALAATAQIMLKVGMNTVTAKAGLFSPTSVDSLKAAASTPMVWVGLVTFGLSALVWLAVLSRAHLSFAYPFASLVYIVLLAYDAFYTDRTISPINLVGVGLIVGGVILVSRGPV